jgi:ketosteroid isomerase-like protein
MSRRLARWFAAAILASGLTVGVSAGESVDAPGHGDLRGALFRAEARLSRALNELGPVEGFVKSAAQGITYLHPAQEIVVGRGNVASLLKTAYAEFEPDARAGLHRVAGDVSADGNLGYTVGWFDENRTKKGTTVVDLTYGRYVAVWRRQGREWEVEAFLRLNSTAALPAAPADALILDGEPGVKRRDHPDAHAVTAALADARFADLSYAQGYSVAFDRYAADAAILVTAGAIFWNRAGVNEAFAGWTPDQSLRWHPLHGAGTGSGDLAWSVGHGNFHFNVGTPGETKSPSKYLTIWLRTPDGWRFLIDGGNARPADPPF